MTHTSIKIINMKVANPRLALLILGAGVGDMVGGAVFESPYTDAYPSVGAPPMT